MVSLGGILVGQYLGFINLLWLADNFLAVLTAAVLFAIALSVFLALYARRSHSVMVADHGNTGT